MFRYNLFRPNYSFPSLSYESEPETNPGSNPGSYTTSRSRYVQKVRSHFTLLSHSRSSIAKAMPKITKSKEMKRTGQWTPDSQVQQSIIICRCPVRIIQDTKLQEILTSAYRSLFTSQVARVVKIRPRNNRS